MSIEKTYHLIVPINRASGMAVYKVVCTSKAQALEKFRNGEAHCIDEQIEVEEYTNDDDEIQVNDMEC